MTTAINGLFANAAQTTSTGNSTLPGTQQLTNLSTVIADTILEAIGKSETPEAIAQIQLSMSDSTVLDRLITSNYVLAEVDVEFLRVIDEVSLDGMLKSQQSKRSRCKSKEMTADNYKSMMTAAIAEMLLRQSMGKEKGAFGGRAGSAVAYGEERLAKLADDQDALRKEIRNVQSKKSILKSKAGFTETDERWLALLVAEEQLKSIRTDAPTSVTIVDPLRTELQELLAEIDEQAMTAKQLKELVASIKLFVWPVEAETNDQI